MNNDLILQLAACLRRAELISGEFITSDNEIYWYTREKIFKVHKFAIFKEVLSLCQKPEIRWLDLPEIEKMSNSIWHEYRYPYLIL